MEQFMQGLGASAPGVQPPALPQQDRPAFIPEFGSPKKSKKKLWIGIGVLGAVLLLIVVFFSNSKLFKGSLDTKAFECANLSADECEKNNDACMFTDVEIKGGIVKKCANKPAPSGEPGADKVKQIEDALSKSKQAADNAQKAVADARSAVAPSEKDQPVTSENLKKSKEALKEAQAKLEELDQEIKSAEESIAEAKKNEKIANAPEVLANAEENLNSLRAAAKEIATQIAATKKDIEAAEDAAAQATETETGKLTVTVQNDINLNDIKIFANGKGISYNQKISLSPESYVLSTNYDSNPVYSVQWSSPCENKNIQIVKNEAATCIITFTNAAPAPDCGTLNFAACNLRNDCKATMDSVEGDDGTDQEIFDKCVEKEAAAEEGVTVVSPPPTGGATPTSCADYTSRNKCEDINDNFDCSWSSETDADNDITTFNCVTSPKGKLTVTWQAPENTKVEPKYSGNIYTGNPLTSGRGISLPPDDYTISGTDISDYKTVWKGSCQDGKVKIEENGNVSCTISYEAVVPASTGTLTVTVINNADLDDINISADGNTIAYNEENLLPSGIYTLSTSYDSVPNYSVTWGEGCRDKDVHISAGSEVTCVITFAKTTAAVDISATGDLGESGGSVVGEETKTGPKTKIKVKTEEEIEAEKAAEKKTAEETGEKLKIGKETQAEKEAAEEAAAQAEKTAGKKTAEETGEKPKTEKETQAEKEAAEEAAAQAEKAAEKAAAEAEKAAAKAKAEFAKACVDEVSGSVGEDGACDLGEKGKLASLDEISNFKACAKRDDLVFEWDTTTKACVNKNAAQIAALNEQIASLQQQIAAAVAAADSSGGVSNNLIATLNNQIESANSRIAFLEKLLTAEAATGGDSGQSAALNSQIAALTNQINDMQQLLSASGAGTVATSAGAGASSAAGAGAGTVATSAGAGTGAAAAGSGGAQIVAVAAEADKETSKSKPKTKKPSSTTSAGQTEGGAAGLEAASGATGAASTSAGYQGAAASAGAVSYGGAGAGAGSGGAASYAQPSAPAYGAASYAQPSAPAYGTAASGGTAGTAESAGAYGAAAANADAAASAAQRGAAAATAQQTAASKKLYGSYIQGKTGPEVLLYPVLIAAANGLYYMFRKRKKR